MSLIDEAVSGAETLAEGAGDVALTVAGDVAYQSIDLAGDVADRALDVAADAADEAVEVVKRVGLRRLLALGLVVAILLVIAKVMKSSGPASVESPVSPQVEDDATGTVNP